MHIWTIEKWKKYYELSNPNHRSGTRLRLDRAVNPDVKRACKEFVSWLRKEYFFPIRVPIYIKATEKIKANDGEMVSATFFYPDDRLTEPYVRIAVGDYSELKNESGQDTALAAILGSIAHELTHYFQWINDLNLTEKGRERQAKAYVRYIIDEYAETREHP